jgi:hypothetical protein
VVASTNKGTGRAVREVGEEEREDKRKEGKEKKRKEKIWKFF